MVVNSLVARGAGKARVNRHYRVLPGVSFRAYFACFFARGVVELAGSFRLFLDGVTWGAGARSEA